MTPGRLAGVYFFDARVSMRAAEDFSVKHAGKRQVRAKL
jgi:hypothetical protein